ncbi:MAG: AAA family ATPase, partial [Thermodesulfobacteriota bacterium]
PMPLHPAELILNGISLGFYPLPHIKESLQSHLDDRAAPALERSGYRLEDFKLNLQETRFFESFDGEKSLREILEGSDLLRQRALSLALSFIITGIIKTASDASTEETLAAEEPVAVAPDTSGMDSRLSAELLFMKTKTAIEHGDYTGAAVTLKEITELNPVEGEYWAWLGWAILNANPSRAKEAESIIKDSIDLNNELDTAWYFLAKVFMAQNNQKAALSAFRTAAEKNPWMLSAIAEIKCLEVSASLTDTARNYMEVYKFDLDPFSPGPISCLLVPTSSQKEALEFLERTIKKKGGPLLLEGTAGVGKTATGIELLKRLSNKKILAALILDPPARELELIRSINAELGATTESVSIKEQLLNLGMRVSQNRTQGGHTIIVIDRAETLTDGCLKLVQYLARLKTLQLVLIAGPKLKARLAQPDFRELSEKLITRFNLNPFSEEEAANFISSRIALGAKGAGGDGFSFSPEELKALYTESSGVASTMLALAAKRAEEKAGSARSSGEIEALENIEAVEPSTETTDIKPTPEIPFKIPGEFSLEEDTDSLRIGEQNTDLSAIDVPTLDIPDEEETDLAPDELGESLDLPPSITDMPASITDMPASITDMPTSITDMIETTGGDEDEERLGEEPDEEVSLEVTSLLDSLNEEQADSQAEVSTPNTKESTDLEIEKPPTAAPSDATGIPKRASADKSNNKNLEEIPTPPEIEGGIKSTAKKPKENRRSSVVTLIIWFIIMLVFGLAAGAFFGIYLNR